MISGRSNSRANDNLYFKNPYPLSRVKFLPSFFESYQRDELPHIILGEKKNRFCLLLSSHTNEGQTKGKYSQKKQGKIECAGKIKWMCFMEWVFKSFKKFILKDISDFQWHTVSDW